MHTYVCRELQVGATASTGVVLGKASYLVSWPLESGKKAPTRNDATYCVGAIGTMRLQRSSSGTLRDDVACRGDAAGGRHNGAVGDDTLVAQRGLTRGLHGKGKHGLPPIV